VYAKKEKNIWRKKMRVSEISKILNLEKIEQQKNLFYKNNSEISQTLFELNNELKTNNRINQDNKNFNFQANSLTNNLQSLQNIDTEYTNPVTGKTENFDITIDNLQTENLKNDLKDFVNSYNKVYKNAQSQDLNIQQEFENITENTEQFGITQNQDGTLKFDESKFDENVKTNETKVSDIKDNLTDISNLVNETKQVSYKINNKVEIKQDNVIKELERIKTDFTDITNIIDFEINPVEVNSYNFMLAGLGIGSSINDLY
jgi:primosomal protein N''